MDHTFKFLNEGLNRRLAALIKKSGAKCSVEKSGLVRYSSKDAEHIENEIICQVRDAAFSRWKIVCCPRDWIESYKTYMLSHHVPFVEEVSDGELEFLIPRKFRPHAWKLQPPLERAVQKRVG